MKIEQIAQILIKIHVLFAGIALVSGMIALVVKKGSFFHKKAGKIFFYSMLLSAFFAMIISLLPNHKSPFLFSIGIFSSFFILTGFLAFRLRKNNPDILLNRIGA